MYAVPEPWSRKEQFLRHLNDIRTYYFRVYVYVCVFVCVCVCVYVCMCVYSSTVKAFSVCKMSETHLRVTDQRSCVVNIINLGASAKFLHLRI